MSDWCEHTERHCLSYKRDMPPPKIRCPKCGRRLSPRLEWEPFGGMDDLPEFWGIPPHKVKGWRIKKLKRAMAAFRRKK